MWGRKPENRKVRTGYIIGLELWADKTSFAVNWSTPTDKVEFGADLDCIYIFIFKISMNWAQLLTQRLVALFLLGSKNSFSAVVINVSVLEIHEIG